MENTRTLRRAELDYCMLSTLIVPLLLKKGIRKKAIVQTQKPEEENWKQYSRNSKFSDVVEYLLPDHDGSNLYSKF